MSQVRIYQPTKNAMQSGRAQLKTWVLEHEPESPNRPDPLMGWIGSQSTKGQIKLKFGSKDEAVAYAKRKGFEYTVLEPKSRRIKPKDYSANFAYDRIR